MKLAAWVCLIAAAFSPAAPAKPAKAAPAGAPNSESLILDGAQNMVVTGRGALVELTGNVMFHRGDVKLRSDRAIWERAAGVVRFEGGFRLDHPSGKLESPHGRYEKASGSAWADGGAHLVDSSGTVTLDAGTIRYDRPARRAEASIHPVFRKMGARGAKDTARDTTEIRADLLSWREKDSVAEAKGTVQIKRGKLLATCGTAVLNQKKKTLTLDDSPKALIERKSLVGKSMVLDVDLKKERIDRVVVYQDARGEVVGDPDTSGAFQTARVFGDTLVAEIDGSTMKSLLVTQKARGTNFTNRDTSKVDQLWGDTLKLDFKAGKMAAAFIRGHARSVYNHMEKNVDKGRNEARGQNIRIAFDDGRIRRIRIDGQAKGTFYGTDRHKPD